MRDCIHQNKEGDHCLERENDCVEQRLLEASDFVAVGWFLGPGFLASEISVGVFPWKELNLELCLTEFSEGDDIFE
jgi:hypothetical protein